MNTSNPNPRCISALFLFLFFFWMPPLAAALHAAESGVTIESPDLLMAAETPEWLIASTIPIAKKCSGKGPFPYFLAFDAENANETLSCVRRLEVKRAIRFTTVKKTSLPDLPEGIAGEIIALGSDPTEAGLRIAERFWGQSQTILMAYVHDTGAMVLGSTLAAHRQIPLIPVVQRDRAVALNQDLVRLGVRKIYFAVTEDKKIPSWMKGMQQEIEVLDKTALTRRLVMQIHPDKVGNLVLARTPVVGLPYLGKSSWLAGYYSLLHNSPLILSDVSDGLRGEEEVYAFWESYSLEPRTLTILADYQSITTILVQDPLLEEYEVMVEPCARPLEGSACPLGVGRIPFADLPQVSLMLAQTIRHERQWQKQTARILMIANPSKEYGPLPLAETASRATAEEFKNLNLHVDEFYGVPTHDPNIRAAAEAAHLIIYEGHITDQTLLQDPEYYQDDIYVSEGYESEHADFTDQNCEAIEDPMDPDSLYSTSDCLSSESIYYQRDVNDSTDAPARYTMDLPLEAPSSEYHFSTPLPKIFHKPIRELQGTPLVILQSCHSLEETVTQQFLQLGGVGMIGSVTNIHSASGSTFIKSFCDSMLYQGATVGEALRDARNYFLCWRELKAKRGHTGMAKVHRVALSFCLWGDPELRVLPPSLPKPSRKAIAVRWKAPDTIRLSTPKRYLPVSQTAKYQARIFPGSQIAGVVKRLKDKEYRRLMPLYFFRLELPQNFQVSQSAYLARQGEPSDRAVFLTDPAQRWIYILYFPEKEEKDDTIELQFVRSSTSEDVAESTDSSQSAVGNELSGAGKP